jgi:hypothetical protein
LTPADRIRQLTQDNESLRLLLGDAIQALPKPRRGRQLGELVDPRFWTDRQLETLLQDIRDENGMAS